MYNKKNSKKNDKNTILKKDNSLRIRDKDGNIPMFQIINREDNSLLSHFLRTSMELEEQRLIFVLLHCL